MDNEKVILDVKDLHVGFRVKDTFYNAVDGVSFTLSKNEKLAIVGESGCGKSTRVFWLLGSSIAGCSLLAA